MQQNGEGRVIIPYSYRGFKLSLLKRQLVDLEDLSAKYLFHLNDIRWWRGLYAHSTRLHVEWSFKGG